MNWAIVWKRRCPVKWCPGWWSWRWWWIWCWCSGWRSWGNWTSSHTFVLFILLQSWSVDLTLTEKYDMFVLHSPVKQNVHYTTPFWWNCAWLYPYKAGFARNAQTLDYWPGRQSTSGKRINSIYVHSKTVMERTLLHLACTFKNISTHIGSFISIATYLC